MIILIGIEKVLDKYLIAPCSSATIKALSEFGIEKIILNLTKNFYKNLQLTLHSVRKH